jgi:hypothetical protein
MKKTIYVLTVILLLFISILNAQENASRDEHAILEVFYQFFKSMHDRDTLTLKNISGGREWFYYSMNNDSVSNTIKGSHGSTFKGFIKTVSNPDGIVGKCNNKFSNIDVQQAGGFSIVTADYKCYVVENEIENCGRYFIQLTKHINTNLEEGFFWKIRKVDRVVLNNSQCFK